MKRSKHLEPLSHDHFEGLLAAKRIHAGIARKADVTVIAAYVRHFWDEYLTRHFAQEEELLLPLLSGTDAAPLGERMVDEHRQLRGLAHAAGDERPDRRALLESFAVRLRGHIRFEERELFPELENRAAEADLKRVSQRLRAEHPETPLAWTMPFWE